MKIEIDPPTNRRGNVTMRYGLKLALIAGCASASLSVVASQAIADPQASASTAVQEVIVTANKRSERLQDVPLSITAITGAQLSQKGVTNIQDVQFSIPGLSTLEYGPGEERVQVRGVSSEIGLNTVGRYLDEMPVNLSIQGSGLDIRLLDMDRVEVLSGPQPTLYGEGSMGGAIRYLTKSPNLTQYSADIEGQVGSIDGGGMTGRADAAVNIPIIHDRFGVRLVAGYEDTGGWIENANSGQKNINGAQIKTLRAKFLLDLTPRDTVTFLVLDENSKQQYQNFGVNGVTHALVPQPNNQNYDLFTGTYTHDFGSFEFVDSPGYLKLESLLGFDDTSSYLPYLGLFGIPPGFVTKIGISERTDAEVTTNEARLQSKGASPFTWDVGVDYRHVSEPVNASVFTEPNPLPFTFLSEDVSFGSTSWSGFGDVGYTHGNLKGSVGFRYYSDREDYAGNLTEFGAPSVAGASARFHSLDPKFTLDYTFTPTSMVYVDVAKGFRSGGFNQFVAVGPASYGPDALWSYELGTKQILLEHKLDVRADVYFNDWTNVQSPFVPAGSPTYLIESGGHVRGWGEDISVDAYPAPGLTLSATWSGNNLKYITATADKLPGDPVDLAVRQTYSASASYKHPLTDKLDGYGRIDYQHGSSSQITERELGQIVHIPSRDLLGLRVGVEFDRYTVGLFANNLTDNRAPLLRPFGSITENVEEQPRTIGVEVKAHF